MQPFEYNFSAFAKSPKKRENGLKTFHVFFTSLLSHLLHNTYKPSFTKHKSRQAQEKDIGNKQTTQFNKQHKRTTIQHPKDQQSKQNKKKHNPNNPNNSNNTLQQVTTQRTQFNTNEAIQSKQNK
jgi:hypothetical protein